MNRTLLTTLALFSLIGAVRQPARTKPGSDWLAQLARRFPCRRFAFPVLPSSNTRNCVLTRAALHEIAIGNAAKYGESPADTARVKSVEVVERNWGEPDGRVWIVAIEIVDKREGLNVIFNIAKRTISVVSGENWFSRERENLARVPSVSAASSRRVH